MFKRDFTERTMSKWLNLDTFALQQILTNLEWIG